MRLHTGGLDFDAEILTVIDILGDQIAIRIFRLVYDIHDGRVDLDRIEKIQRLVIGTDRFGIIIDLAFVRRLFCIMDPAVIYRIIQIY